MAKTSKKPTAKKKAKTRKGAKDKKVVVVTKSRRGKLTPSQKKSYMDAMTGNSWWQIRSKHGRDRLFESPQLMWEAALQYFNWCEDNPEKRAELVKYEGSAVEEEVSVKRLYTLIGVCLYMGASASYFRAFKAGIRAKDPQKVTPQDKDFLTVINLIEETVENQQVSGAASGFFNGNIISRLVGLVDKKDVTSGDEPLSAPVFKIYNTGPALAGSEEEVQP
jgi:hypothetical protein